MVINLKYDFLLVGAGLYNAIFACEMYKKGKKCFVIDKRNHIGGNVYTEEIEGINVHKYGAHIFHTDDKEVWEYVQRFAEFNHYTNSPVANYKGEIYNLPFNMNTFSRLWNIKTPSEAKAVINSQKTDFKEPKNLEEQALNLVGKDIYEKLIKEYTEKQWGRKCTELPAFIIKRLPVRFTYDNNYFNDKYQGIPIGGYTKIIEKMFENCEIRLNTPYTKDMNNLADKIVFTGAIDGYFDFKLGRLEYRTVRFETEILNTDNYQGNAVVNYTSHDEPYTRIIEHKHFDYGAQEKTVISKEYSKEFEQGDEPYYPVNDEKNNALYEKYNELKNNEKNVIFGGRLGQYKYFDMWQVVRNALDTAKQSQL